MTDEPRPQVKPLDPPMVPFAVVGIAIWAVVALVLWALHDRLRDAGHGSWLPIAVAGAVWGFPGLATMLVHDRNRRRRRAVSGSVTPESVTPGSVTPGAVTSDSFKTDDPPRA